MTLGTIGYKTIFFFVKYCVVGALGLVIDFSITYLVKEKLKYNPYVANSLGFTIAVLHNFYLNKVWTFDNHNQEVEQQLLKFILFSVAGLCVNNILIYLSQKTLKINFYVAKIFAIICVTLLNFSLNYYYTFGE